VVHQVDRYAADARLVTIITEATGATGDGARVAEHHIAQLHPIGPVGGIAGELGVPRGAAENGAGVGDTAAGPQIDANAAFFAGIVVY
jgi:hypothetical protein